MVNYKKKGFKRTFLVILATALLVAGGSVVYWWQVSHRLQQDVQVILDAAGKELAGNISRVLTTQQRILTTLAVSLKDDPVLEKLPELASYLNDQNGHSSLALTGYQFDDGRTVFSDGHTQQFFLSPQLVEFIKKENFVIIYQTTHPFADGQKHLFLATSVWNKKQPWGIVFALQPLENYQAALKDLVLTDISLSMVINPQGDVIMSYPQDAKPNMFEVIRSGKPDKRFPLEKLYQDLEQGKDGFFGYIFDGKQRFLSYYPIGYNGWYAVAILPTVSVAQEIKSLVWMSLVLCLSIIAALGLLLAFILRMQHQNSKELYKMGFVDALTGYDNLNALQLKLPAALAALKEQSKQGALVLLNLNRFKALNDIYGFEQGDRLLVQIAHILKEELHENELFCRNEADRFLLLLAFPGLEEFSQRLETLIGKLEKNCKIGQEVLPLSLTCGVYIAEEDTPFYIMTDRAKLALDTAKQQAGSRYAFYDREYLQKIVTEKHIESNMETALKERQFKVYLQPKYSFETGRMVGAEALVRWVHPTQGMIRPDWFIPVFEKNAFVLKLDHYIWQEVVTFLKNRQENGLHVVPVGVNFSRLHLDDPQFIETLSAVFKNAGLEAKWLEVELTESVVFGNTGRMQQVLDGLHAQGLSVAMDDFGAGYSSLNVLKNLDFDCVKLDKEFLARGESNPRMRQVISGLVKMVKELGSKIVAEGVETKEQAEFLRSIGCDTAQGFLYSRPLPMDEFEKKLDAETR